MEVTFKHTRIFYETANSRGIRFVVNEGGTRSSKTWSLLTLFLLKCLSNPNAGKTTQIFRKTLTACHRTVYKDFCELVDFYNLWDYVKQNKSNSTFEINGNLIEFCGADQAQKLRGAKRCDAWINETNEFSDEEFKQIKMRTENQIFMDYNPSFTDSWIYDMMEVESKTPSEIMLAECKKNNGVFTSERVKLIQSTYKDNPYLSPEIIKDIENLSAYDDNDYNVYALGIRSNPSGFIFKRVYYETYEILPADCIGVLYCDPNNARKGKGDTTAIVKMLYSRETGKFYIDDVICRNFTSPNILLDNLLRMYSSGNGRIRFIGFDGNFTQESTWTAHVENYAKINRMQFPVIDYKRYRVDETLKSTQYLWNDRQILFNKNIELTEDGSRFLGQVYTFEGKKKTMVGNHDDAPDAMICSVNYLQDLGLINQNNNVINNIFKNIIGSN